MAADLSAALRHASKALHVQAERSGIVAAILRGTATKPGYAMFLRNLQPVYQALEQGLSRHRCSPGVRLLARPETYRSMSLEADLLAMEGTGWAASIPLLPESAAYVDAVAAAAADTGTGLIAHAYTRTLGDLSGGQIMARLLNQGLGLPHEALSFYRFENIPALAAYKAAYRAWLDDAGAEIDDVDRVAQEAARAFRLNIDLSEAVAAHVDGSRTTLNPPE